MRMRGWVVAGLLLFSNSVFAGPIEIGLSSSYRKSSIDSNNLQESLSFTGGLTFYLWELSALELSYTDGRARTVTQPIGGSKVTTTWAYEMAGLDFVLSLADRDSFIQPYVKLGGAYIQKKATQEVDSGAVVSLPIQRGIVPSAGAGFKIALTKQLSLKIGVDAWTTPLGDRTVMVDLAGRAGLSWMF